jgi:acyl-[acyl-carrier-protein]-phospholipid O-acyltransferase/long-chain-fatty-acid--[acyl-carrier-protein] ligase
MSTDPAPRAATAPASSSSSQPDTPLPPPPAGWRSLGRAFVQAARAHRDRRAIADSLGADLTYGETLLRALALGRVLGRAVGPNPYVGVFLPPSAPAAVANIALTLMGKVPVNLNYTVGQDVLDSCGRQCGLTHVITSRRAVEKFGLKPPGEPVYLEDVPKQVTALDKAFAGAAARAVPLPLLGALLPGLRGERPGRTATVIFTSGSTGEPKGVVLSHGNVLNNVRQINAAIHLHDEVVMGILPFFHSFGYTVTLWTALLLGFRSVFHISPLDARIVANLVEQQKATMIASSPTFMRGFARKAEPGQFATVRLPILGAEKLKPEVAAELRERLGIEPLEGYGCTETGPVVAVNVPETKRTPDGRTVPGNRPGTVGMPVPGTAIRTIDPDTGAELPRGAEGIVCVKGPQIMQGYLERPEATAQVLRDGWYVTGDLGHLDADGFLRITGRLSRFSKIGGEMVPHERVESAILEVAVDDHPHVAVTALPDLKRGERLVVLHTDLGLPPHEVFKRLAASSLPKLWLPSAEDFIHVDSIPLLATGKVDLRQVRKIAEERFGGGGA